MTTGTMQLDKSRTVLDKNSDTFQYLYECAVFLKYDYFDSR